jgi:signal transduction histidine kinase/CheY-like chemotaxis protein
MDAESFPGFLSGDIIGLDDLRQGVLLGCAAACLIAPFAVMLAFSRPSGTAEWVSTAILALDLVGILTLLASRVSSAAGGAVLTAGLLGLGVGSLGIPALSGAANLLPVVVLVASTFFENAGGPLAAVVITGALALAREQGMGTDLLDLPGIVVLSWANVAAAWLAARPTRMALRWSWSEYRRAEREADRARRQQAELARVVKSLTITQDRLEEVNRELERARRAADEARRLKAEFAAAVSHELRTPLNLIIGFSELLAADAEGRGGPPDPATFQRDIDTIYRNARYLSSLIDDILDLAQIDAARMGLVREMVDLPALVRDAAATVEPLYTRKGLALELDVPEDLPPVLADRARVRQVLVNLLSNAARFTDLGGARVRARAEDHHVIVEVSDSGAGIPPEDLPYVFEEFRQVKGPLGRPLGHSGLGLAISKRLIEMHGGTMGVESVVGRGTTFFFTLPRQETVVSGTLRRDWDTWARVPGEGGTRGAIVVYDTEPETIHLVRRHFNDYDVLTAATLAEVGRARDERVVHAILVTGPSEPRTWHAGRALRERFPDLPVLLCPLPGRRRLADELGVVDYLVKPVLRDQIARGLRRAGGTLRDIVVVDDDPDFVDLLERMIRALVPRARVRVCYSGAEALAALRTAQPDLVLLDLVMPGMDGYALLEAMRTDEGLRSVPVIVLSARGRQEEALTAGMLGISRGPGLTLTELVGLLRTTIDALARGVPSTDPGRLGVPPG